MGQRAKPTKRPPAPVARDLVPFPAYCSFCFKDQDRLTSLVAGPSGVFICGECVAVCTDLVARGAPAFPAYPGVEALETPHILALLQPLETMAREKNGQLRWAVQNLRARKVSWAKIGKALGISRQSAWERFSKPGQAAKTWRLLHLSAGESEQPAREP